MSKRFSYASNTTPPDYVCTRCKASGCKLWRLYQTFLDHQKLFCLPCAEADQQVRLCFRRSDPYASDQIGALVPAVPTVELDTYWGYTSVPEPGVEWWYRLPTAPAREACR
jgi:hypothetical protein